MSLYDSIVITGGGGMLGNALHDLLKNRGRRPVALPRSELDVGDLRAIDRMFVEYTPTLVLNCAAHTKVDLCEQERERADAVNGMAVGRTAAQCRRTGAVLVHVSTDFVFDGKSTRPYVTTDAVNPLSVYGKSKLLGEQELQKNAPERWLIARTAWVYGRHGLNFPRTMVQAARAGKPLTVVSDQVGAPTWATDLGAAILDLLESGASGIWNVTNSGQASWYEFAVATLEEFGVKSDISPISSAGWSKMKPTAAIRPGYSVLDLRCTENQMKRPMRPWREALRDFRADVEAHGF
jgi:dTDP-4-dehydrorhamnose reductase